MEITVFVWFLYTLISRQPFWEIVSQMNVWLVPILYSAFIMIGAFIRARKMRKVEKANMA